MVSEMRQGLMPLRLIASFLLVLIVNGCHVEDFCCIKLIDPVDRY